MLLLTEKLKKELPKLYANEGKSSEEVKVIAKFFYPAGRFTWYVTEGEKRGDNDWIFFGYVKGNTPQDDELGYFTLSQLSSSGNMLFQVERDKFFGKHTLKEVIEEEL